MRDAENQKNEGALVFARRVALAVSIAAMVALLLLLVWYAVDVLLLVFAGILVAIFLRGLSDKLSERAGLSGSWSLAVVLLALVAVIVAAVWWLAPSVAEQTDELTSTLPRAVERLQSRIERYGWARRALSQLPPVDEMLPEVGRQKWTPCVTFTLPVAAA